MMFAGRGFVYAFFKKRKRFWDFSANEIPFAIPVTTIEFSFPHSPVFACFRYDFVLPVERLLNRITCTPKLGFHDVANGACQYAASQ